MQQQMQMQAQEEAEYMMAEMEAEQEEEQRRARRREKEERARELSALEEEQAARDARERNQREERRRASSERSLLKKQKGFEKWPGQAAWLKVRRPGFEKRWPGQAASSERDKSRQNANVVQPQQQVQQPQHHGSPDQEQQTMSTQMAGTPPAQDMNAMMANMKMNFSEVE